jgi:hypothetical protein
MELGHGSSSQMNHGSDLVRCLNASGGINHAQSIDLHDLDHQGINAHELHSGSGVVWNLVETIDLHHLHHQGINVHELHS